jgi:hypothetical protein
MEEKIGYEVTFVLDYSTVITFLEKQGDWDEDEIERRAAEWVRQTDGLNVTRAHEILISETVW